MLKGLNIGMFEKMNLAIFVNTSAHTSLLVREFLAKKKNAVTMR